MDGLVDFTSLSTEILTKLGEDFVRALSVPNPQLIWVSVGREKPCADRISEVVSRAKTSPTGLSSQDATALAKTFHEVCLRNKISPRPLIPLVLRPPASISVVLPFGAHGSDFILTPSSVDRTFSPT